MPDYESTFYNLYLFIGDYDSEWNDYLENSVCIFGWIWPSKPCALYQKFWLVSSSIRMIAMQFVCISGHTHKKLCRPPRFLSILKRLLSFKKVRLLWLIYFLVLNALFGFLKFTSNGRYLPPEHSVLKFFFGPNTNTLTSYIIKGSAIKSKNFKCLSRWLIKFWTKLMIRSRS